MLESLDTSLPFEVEDFLNQFDISTLSSTQGMRSFGNTNDSTPAKPVSIEPCIRHQVYRKRRRAERERLEQEVEDLKMKLASEPRRQWTLASWRMVSLCQLEARLASEEQQRRLRAAISAQEALIRQYQGLIAGKLVQENTFSGSGFQHQMLRVESFDTAFYQASDSTFDAVYAQINEVFREFQLDSTDERCGISVQEGVASGKTYVQFTDKRYVPFSFERASRFLTRTLAAHQQSDQQTCEGIQDPDNTVCIKFRVSTILKSGENASVLLRVMNRRYREEKRVVVVWRAFAQGEGAFSGMYADETGWATLTPSTTCKSQSSILRLYARYVPLNVGTVSGEVVKKKFTGMIVEASTQNSDEIACSLEKLELN
ncbi:hypothetical protein V7S43_009955 [Phytophthora oleae]|uniref:M96 mating-specific protein family n=1 Tax=Phytophthora oleae TaxID=2107226 RepID=A0ABD3FFX7_9STRA